MLQLKEIVKDYGSDETIVHALKGVTLSFRNSEFVAIEYFFFRSFSSDEAGFRLELRSIPRVKLRLWLKILAAK